MKVNRALLAQQATVTTERGFGGYVATATYYGFEAKANAITADAAKEAALTALARSIEGNVGDERVFVDLALLAALRRSTHGAPSRPMTPDPDDEEAIERGRDVLEEREGR